MNENELKELKDKIDQLIQDIAEIKNGKLKVNFRLDKTDRPQLMDLEWVLDKLWFRDENNFNKMADKSKKLNIIIDLVFKILSILFFIFMSFIMFSGK